MMLEVLCISTETAKQPVTEQSINPTAFIQPAPLRLMVVLECKSHYAPS